VPGSLRAFTRDHEAGFVLPAQPLLVLKPKALVALFCKIMFR
jgi:hypothetical protein